VLTKKSMLGSIGKSQSTAVADSAADSVEGAWGMATTDVDISADRCLAFLWHHMSHESNARFDEKNNGRLLKMQVDVPDSHSTFMVMSQKSSFPGVDNRLFASKWVWRRDENGDLVAGFTFKGERASERAKRG
jgi:hypothetical protein